MTRPHPPRDRRRTAPYVCDSKPDHHPESRNNAARVLRTGFAACLPPGALPIHKSSHISAGWAARPPLTTRNHSPPPTVRRWRKGQTRDLTRVSAGQRRTPSPARPNRASHVRAHISSDSKRFRRKTQSCNRAGAARTRELQAGRSAGARRPRADQASVSERTPPCGALCAARPTQQQRAPVADGPARPGQHRL